MYLKQLSARALCSYCPKTGNALCGGQEVGSLHLSSQVAASTNHPGVRPCSHLWLTTSCASTGFITSLSSSFK